ncbi:MAG: ABC transporter substrate-binding protein [Planctomycetes bacterium]|nr:ABC transporter substrate-binding protein [Planctomycetota bacterium]
MNMRRWTLFGGAVLLVAVVALIVILTRPSESPATVRIGYLNITASLPLFIAEEKGYFGEEGVQVETHQIASSNQLVDGVIAGNLDAFIEASAVPVLAVELQSPGRLKVFSVSSITRQAPFDALLVKEDSPLRSLQDLAGKKIGVFPGSTATNLLRKFFADRGIDVSNITFVPMPPQNHLTALLEGSVDAVHAYEPTIAIALSRGGVRQLYGSAYAEMLDRNPQGVAVISVRFAQEHPETARKVIRALERAMVFMREHEAEARQILARRMNLQPEVANRSVFLYMLPHREIDSSIFQRYSDMLTELGELKGRVTVDGLLYHD